MKSRTLGGINHEKRSELRFWAFFKRLKPKVIKDIENLLGTCDNLYITILKEDDAENLKQRLQKNSKTKVVTFEEFLKKVDRELNIRNRTIKNADLSH